MSTGPGWSLQGEVELVALHDRLEVDGDPLDTQRL
jgi:hypothetical protein